MWDILSPILGTVITIAVPALLALGIAQFTRLTGIQIEAKHREALQSALTNGALLALARASGNPQSVMVGEAVKYVRRSVPDAVRKFGLDDDMIADLALPAIEAARRSMGKP